MADDNKNPAGDTERTSILPQSEAQATEHDRGPARARGAGGNGADASRHPGGDQQCVCWYAPGVGRGSFCR